ncbi:MAG: response regulator [Odoribacter sp.]
MEVGEKMNSGYCILYAEDDERTASVTKEILEMEGFQIEIANDGKEAWKLFQTTKPDLLLLDLKLPEKSGLDLVKLIRKQNAHIPIVLYSTYASTENIVEAIQNGANDFIDKSGDTEILLVKLKGILERITQNGGHPFIYRLSPSTLYNSTSNILTIAGEQKRLTPMESLCLTLLCVKMGEIADRVYLLEGLFKTREYQKEADLRRYISHLRKYLQSDPSIIIENRRECSYCLLLNQA